MAFSLLVPFTLTSTSGVLTPGVDLSAAGVIKLNKNGSGGFANRAGAAPTSIGLGAYVYTCDATEIPDSGFVLMCVTIAGYKTQIWRENIGLVAFSHRTGRTVLGLLRRLDAFATNKASGLNGASPTFLQPDGATAEYSQSQNIGAGTRGTPTVTNSETP